MGIFTSTGFSGTSVDIYSPAEQELCCEGFDINFYEASMVAVAESEAIYNRSMKEIGIAELRYFEENGQEVIYEAVDVKAIFNKIKMFFKKLIDKVKAIFHTFIAKLSSMVQSDKDFVKKYEKEFARKWNDVKDDFEFKGYTFTIKDDIGADADFDEKNANHVHTYEDSKNSDLDTINGNIKDMKENRDDINDAIRAGILNIFKKASSTYKSDDQTSLDAKDFSEELFKIYRNGETSKESIEKNEIVGGVATITTELRTAEKTKRIAEKMTKGTIRNIDKDIKELERLENNLLREMPDKTGSTAEEKNTNTNIKSALISLCSEYASVLRSGKEFTIQANGALLQALKDRSRQYKAIMVKVISGSKKMQRESYDYTNESYEYGSGSFLDSVVLK